MRPSLGAAPGAVSRSVTPPSLPSPDSENNDRPGHRRSPVGCAEELYGALASRRSASAVVSSAAKKHSTLSS